MPVFQLSDQILFPPTELAEPDGLIAVGGDLSAKRLLVAYQAGIFPWFGEGDPILWWATDPRLVLFTEEFHAPRRLLRIIRQGKFRVTADTAFAEVINNCARQRSYDRVETWITAEMLEAYSTLHKLGYAHSIECWQEERLAGGLYGVCLGGIFFGESMFSAVSNSSKVALYHLIQFGLKEGIHLIDCQIRTDHLLRFGAREIPRSRFEKYLRQHIPSVPSPKKWRLHEDR